MRTPHAPHRLFEQLYARFMAMSARQFRVASDQGHIENFCKHHIGGIVRRDRIAQRPNSLQELPVLRAMWRTAKRSALRVLLSIPHRKPLPHESMFLGFIHRSHREICDVYAAFAIGIFHCSAG